jgi:hypothetical protein
MKVTAVLLLFAFSPLTALAQSTTGNLEGWIRDTSGAPAVGVNVAVTSPVLQGIRGVSSDERGFFRLIGLPTGEYTVKVHHVSFQSVTVENVRIWLGRTTTLAQMSLKPGSVEMDEVVVSGERRLLDPASVSSGANLPLKKFEVLPLDRNYRTIASLAPGADQSFYGDEVNIAGATGAENKYFIDGHDVTNWYNGLGGTNLPYNFVREVEVKTGGYEPEYRSSLGGTINVITYSGGNDFTGQAFGFWTNSDFSGAPQLAANEPPRGAFSQYDFGLAIGGPIVHDRLWFSAAFDPSYRNEDKRIPALGYYPAQSRALNFAGKLSWKASESLDITATVLGDPTTEESVGGPWFWGHYSPSSASNPDPFLVDVTQGGYSGQVDARYVAGQSLILQGSLSWIAWRQRYLPSTARGAAEAYFYDGATGTASGGTGEEVDITTSIPDVELSATALLGDHTVKAGLGYRRPLVDNTNTYFRITKNSDTDYRMAHYDLSGKAWTHSLSAFVQDSWTVDRSWRILAGLRWDGQFVMASNGELMMRILREIQPRVGIVFMPAGDETRKIFASAGRYQEDVMAYASTMYYIDGAYQRITRFNHDPRLDPTGGVTTMNAVATLPPEPEDLYGQYYDEVALGYEQLLARDLKIGVKGTYRTMRQAIDDAEAPPGTDQFFLANPGEGVLGEYPHPKREYSALELSLEKSWGSAFSVLASYVLSRTYGNWLGMYTQKSGTGGGKPNAAPQFDYLDLLDNNATGLLPNDRTHVFKVNAAYRFGVGLTCGASFLWESGTPLSEFAGTRGGGGNWVRNLVQRGSAGRMPSLWDLNIRLSYAPSFWNDARLQPRLIVDIMHLGSQRKAVVQEELHYLDTDDDGNPVFPNSTYGMPTKFQPPMSVRVGLEVSF